MTSTIPHDERHAAVARTLTAFALSGALLGLLGATVAHAETAAPPDAPDSTAPVTADATSPDPAAPLVVPAAAPASFTLPLFGADLTVDITTGPGGALSSVTLNPANGFTAVAARPNKVAFVNENGTAQVVVKSRNGGQRVEARAGSLADILGLGGWTGEVFPGAPGSVEFEIVDEGGYPNIVLGAVSGPNPEIGEVKTSNGDGDDPDEAGEREAKVAIRFSQDGQSRWLTIKAKVETDDEDGEDDDSTPGASEAKVQISLSKIRTSFTGVDALGQQEWKGTLCDGTQASILFTVAVDGTLTIDQVTPTPERQKVEGKGVEVRFGRGQGVRIRVRSADGSLAVKVDERIRCSDAPDPSLNVPVASDDDNHDDDDGDAAHSDDDNGGRRDGRSGKGDGDHADDNPTESNAPSTPAPGDTVADGSGSDD